MPLKLRAVLAASLLGLAGCGAQVASTQSGPAADRSTDARLGAVGGEMKLADGWSMTSADEAGAEGEVLSTVGFDASVWLPTRVPSTVYGTLADNGRLGDIFVGNNFDDLPEHPSQLTGSTEYWFRVEFVASESKQAWLLLRGVNHSADVWLNGQQIAAQADCFGPFIAHEYRVTDLIKAGVNALAIKVNETSDRDYPYDLVWNDWSPYKDAAGIVGEVTLRTTAGNVAVKDPYVVTTGLELPNPQTATISVNVDLDNGSGAEVSGVLKGEISRPGTAPIPFELPVTLDGDGTRRVSQEVIVSNPALWWPYQLGSPDLYQLRVWFEVDGEKSDSTSVEFGIRRVREYKTAEGWWGLEVNGNPMLVRGAGYSPEAFLRYPTARNAAEIGYFKSMGLNTLRFEGLTTNTELFDLCDREGILIMDGENCVWEGHAPDGHSDDDTLNDYSRGYAESQLRQLRHHPSLAIWNNGSDIEPSPSQTSEVEQILSGFGFRQDSAFARNVSDWGALDPWDGIKMQGPYNYVGPAFFWEGNTEKGGGAWGFCAEEGPGIMFPEYESFARFMPEGDRWPINETWRHHAPIYVGATSDPLYLTRTSIDARYGESSSAEDFLQKAQLSQYESVRAMFEAYAANKSNASRPSTGVIMWMLNMNIPGMGWQLYDYYLKPNSATFATQKACAKTLHVSYDYAGGVWINHEGLEPTRGVRVSAQVYDLDQNLLVEREESLPSVLPNHSERVLQLGDVPESSAVYFVKLQLKDDAGQLLDDNVYWYSTTRDVVEFDQQDGLTTQYADLTALSNLPINDDVAVSGSRAPAGDGTEIVTLTLENRSSTRLAFFMRVEVTKGRDGLEVTPITYSENEVTLWPHETRQLSARYATPDLGEEAPFLRVRGFRVSEQTSAIDEQ